LRKAFFFTTISPLNSSRSQPAVVTDFPAASLATKSYSNVPIFPATTTLRFSNFPSGKRSKNLLTPFFDFVFSDERRAKKVRANGRMINAVVREEAGDKVRIATVPRRSKLRRALERHRFGHSYQKN
jgi:hypothetical protein